MRTHLVARNTVLCLVVLAVALLGSASPAAALLGTTPTIAVTRTGNTIESFTVSEISVNRGIAEASENAGFSLVLSAQFTSGDLVLGVDPCGIVIAEDKQTELRQGSTVPLVPHTHALEAELADALKAELDAGKTFTLEVTIHLVLTDGSGATHILDSASAVGVVDPKVD